MIVSDKQEPPAKAESKAAGKMKSGKTEVEQGAGQEAEAVARLDEKTRQENLAKLAAKKVS